MSEIYGRSDKWIEFYNSSLDRAYEWLEDLDEDMNKLSDRDKHIIDTVARACYVEMTENGEKYPEKNSKCKYCGGKMQTTTKCSNQRCYSR